VKTARFLLVFLLSSLLYTKAYAVPTPCFNVVDYNTGVGVGATTGCYPFRVRIQSCAFGAASASDVTYQQKNLIPDTFDPSDPLNNPVVPGTTFRFVYNLPGRYYLTQFITYVDGTGTRQQVSYSVLIIVLDKIIPTVDVKYCQNYKVHYTISKQPGEALSVTFDEPYNNPTEVALPVDSRPSFETTFVYSSTPLNRTIKIYNLNCGSGAGRLLTSIPVTLPLFSNPTRFDLLLKTDQSIGRFTALTSDENWLYSLSRRNSSGTFDPVVTTTVPGQPNVFYAPITAGTDTVFQITTYDFCGQQVAYGPQQLFVYKPIVATQPGQNTVTWSVPTKPSDYKLATKMFRNTFPIGDAAGDNDSPFIDDNVNCSEYCYVLQVEAQQLSSNPTPLMVFNNTDPRNLTDPDYTFYKYCVGSTTTTTSEPPGKFVVSVADPNVSLSYELPTGSTATAVLFNRGITDSSALTPNRTSFENPFTDKIVDVDNISYCYNVYYIDACEKPSYKSKTLCSVLLTLNRVNATPVNKLFTWKPYEGFDDAQRTQTFERIASDGSVIDAEALSNTDRTYTDTRPFLNTRIGRYRVKAVQTSSGLVSYSNVVEYIQPEIPIYPDAFSPNGDGLNDVLLPLVTPLRDFTVRLYNRWGNLVFSSSNPTESWDGSINGDKCPSGAYVYSIQGIDDTGQDRTVKGTVMLVR